MQFSLKAETESADFVTTTPGIACLEDK